jgi:predicted acylesterase/phospholipase RssA
MKGKIGLVFSGGGGKGAYEIGVWKAFKEYGIDKYVCAVSGTSVGALNAALFATTPYEVAENTWKNISQDKVLFWDPEEIIKKIGSVTFVAKFAPFYVPVLIATAGFGWFSQKGLRSLIENHLDFNSFSSSIPVYVCATRVGIDEISTAFQKLNELDRDEIVNWLLASAAIPLVFSPVDINGSKYYDGGLKDNTPVAPILDHNPEFIFAVHLSNDSLTEETRDKAGGRKIWNIVPSEEVGGLISGTMNFTAEKAKKLIDAGYLETIKVLQDLYEFMLSEKRFVSAAEELGHQNNSFKTLLSQNKMIKLPFKEERNSVLQMNSLEYLITYGDEIANQNVQNVVSENTFDIMAEIEKQIEEGEKAIISDAVDKIIDEMKDNSDELISQAFDGITALSSTPGKIRYLDKQGFLLRIWEELTGRNQKLQGEINMDFHRAIYANQKMIQKLSERSALTLDIMAGLGNKINFTMTHINNLYGRESLQMQAIQGIRSLQGKIFVTINKKFAEQEEKINTLENFNKIHVWRGSLAARKYESIPEKVDFFVRSYVSLPKDKTEMPVEYFRAALKESLQIKESDSITVQEHLELVKNKRDGVLGSFDNDQQFFPVSEKEKTFFPVISAFQESLDGDKEFSKINEIMIERYSFDISEPIPVLDYVTEIIGFVSRKQKKTIKDEYLGKLRQLKDVCSKNSLPPTIIEKIDHTIKEITEFKAKIPLIGRFSAGKSRLINAWLGKDILKVDTDPTTSLATELHHGEEENAELHYTDGKIKKCGLKDIPENEEECKKIAFVKVFLNNQRLKLWKDIVIVDMPGIDSNASAHTKAVLNYVGQGSYFIAVLDPKDAFNSSLLSFIDELASYSVPSPSFIMTRKNTEADVPEIIDKFSKFISKRLEETVVGSTESGMNPVDIDDFEKVIRSINDRFDELLKNRFEHRIEELFLSAVQAIKAILKSADMSTMEIGSEIEKLSQLKDKESKKFDSTCKEVEREMVTVYAQRAISTASSAVVSNEDGALRAHESGTLEHFVTSIVRPALVQSLNDATAYAEEKLNTSLGEIKTSLDSEILSQIAFSGDKKETPGSSKLLSTVGGGSVGAVAAGVVLSGGFVVIGFLVGALIGFFSKKADREKESRNKAEITRVVIQSIDKVVKDEMGKHAGLIISKSRSIFDQMMEEKEETLKEMKKKAALSSHDFAKKKEFFNQALILIEDERGR